MMKMENEDSRTGSIGIQISNQDEPILLPQERPSYFQRLKKLLKKVEPPERYINFSGTINYTSPSNAVKNTKYNIITFFPLFLFYQFGQPLNLFFLVIALSQFYPPLQVGFLFTYIAPLALVTFITMSKEAYDDLVRWQRDREVNNQLYTCLSHNGSKRIPSEEIKVGDFIEIHSHERIPADMILMQTSDESGTVFIKTDQLDGETDWKLRKAVVCTQRVRPEMQLLNLAGVVTIKAPHKNIYEFEGKIELEIGGKSVAEGLGLENTVWSSTSLASGSCIGFVIYTGKETRSVMNGREPSNKLGATDIELNRLAMYLLILMISMSFLIVCLAGFSVNTPISFFRFLLLLSTIIPISLRVNLDFAKIYYSYHIAKDPLTGNAKPRNSTIPEELGRIHILLTDKTGTLTKNDMILKRLSFEYEKFSIDDKDSMEDLLKLMNLNYQNCPAPIGDFNQKKKRKRDTDMVVRDMITALTLCHNVTPVMENNEQIYQASSPDEIALVNFTKSIGVELHHRSQEMMIINTPAGIEEYKILQMFPFTSSSKRMGIILYHEATDNIIFYLKGAEEVLKEKIGSQISRTRMIEDCENLAQEGLRTLVVSQKILTKEEYEAFLEKFNTARVSLVNREIMIRAAIDTLEVDMEYLGVTGVEDKLQDKVDKSIAKLKNAGIKVWMLTGDKFETAKCIAISTGLKKHDQTFYEIVNMCDRNLLKETLDELRLVGNQTTVLVVDGISIHIALEAFEEIFVQVASQLGGVVCCRASPTQKTQVVDALKRYTKNRVCSIGDGGNDVGMIQAAHVGVGIEGKEGKQASLAADYSISEFRHVTALILWHGRMSYLRTSRLANFIFHRGLIIAVIQFMFSMIFYYIAIPIYNGYLMLGYTTIFTSMPVFSIVLDKDIEYKTIKNFPILYQTLQMGRALNSTRFLLILVKSIYQGSVIILCAILLFIDDSFINIVAITFSALILTELLNIATMIETWTRGIIISEIAAFTMYAISILALRNYFDVMFILTPDFFWKVLLITTISWLPLYLGKFIKDKLMPSKAKQIRENS
ncbi:ATP9A_2 [Blepharisma stoltei]|uniref:Phospholipid-transporting ATPase n=1 Tax=Blepharisma stoltei TaxID=1481888 RepID=A0AAU9JWT3_9CILI|nr:unnamed protein product [Blepharisma stoltei]